MTVIKKLLSILAAVSETHERIDLNFETNLTLQSLTLLEVMVLLEISVGYLVDLTKDDTRFHTNLVKIMSITQLTCQILRESAYATGAIFLLLAFF